MEKTISLQDDDFKNKFRSEYLKGKEVKEILIEMGIAEGSWDSAVYRNTHGIREWYQEVKKEYFIREAERFSKKLLALEENDDGRIYALKQKEVEFLRETLGKDIYSKKTEIDNTQPITINVNNLHNKDTKAIQSHEKHVAQSTLCLPTEEIGVSTPITSNIINNVKIEDHNTTTQPSQ